MLHVRESTTRYYCGDDKSCLDDSAWYSANSGAETHPVGQKQPNAWGLYDMTGNLWEYCEDYYDDGYYEESPDTDPQGPDEGFFIVMRGWRLARRCSTLPCIYSRKRFCGYGQLDCRIPVGSGLAPQGRLLKRRTGGNWVMSNTRWGMIMRRSELFWFTALVVVMLRKPRVS